MADRSFARLAFLSSKPGLLLLTATALCFALIAVAAVSAIFDLPYIRTLGAIAAICLFIAAIGASSLGYLFKTGRDQKLKLLFFRWLNRDRVSKSTPSVQELGRLDGEHESALYGWALDANDESKPSKVILYIDGRPRAEALAVHYRPDVGAHCFFFDLLSLEEMDRDLTADVRFSDGRLLANTPFLIRTPPAPRAVRKEAVLFLHISKTAGTAFREALADNYRQCEIAYAYPDVPGMLTHNLGDLSLEQRRIVRLVSGHFQYGIHSFFPQHCEYISIVRDPVERLVSEHRFYREKKGEDAELSASASLIKMLEHGQHTNLDNLYVRCFSGVNESDLPPGAVTQETYERALANLRAGFHFVGHQSNLGLAYERLRERYGWKPRAAFERVNTTRVGTTNEYAEARGALEHFNRWDIKLYAEILRLFPIS